MYAVYNYKTKEFMTCALNGASYNYCKEFYDKLNNGLKKQCKILAFGWYQV